MLYETGFSLAAVALAVCLAGSTRTMAANLDYRGRPVPEGLNPKRVVALMPHIAETIVELGGADRLVAAPQYSSLAPSVAKQVRNLGPYNHISTETVYSSRPNLVIASMDGNDVRQVVEIEKMGLRVLTVNTLSLSDVVRSTEMIARALGPHDASKLAALKRALGQPPSSPRAGALRVFLQLGWAPLVTISKNTFIDELLRLAGARNVFADAAMKHPRPSPEEVVTSDPEVIVICRLTDNGTDTEQSRHFWRRFAKMTAVKNGRLHVIPCEALTKPGFSLLEGLKQLKKVL